MFGLIARVLEFLYALVPSYGAAITLLTFAIMLLLYPLTARGTRSMIAMQRVAPEIKKLQALHKDDRVKLNEEVMQLYKAHGVNPLGGCLPLLLQLPVFFILFKVISGLTHTAVAGAIIVGGQGSNPELQGAKIDDFSISSVKKGGAEQPERVDNDGRLARAKIKGDVVVDGRVVGQLSGARILNGVIVGEKATDPAKVVNDGNQVGTIQGARVENAKVIADPRYVSSDSKLHKDLEKTPGEMQSWGLDLAKAATSDELDGAAEQAPYWLLLVLMTVTAYIQQAQLMRRNKKLKTTPDSPQAEMQQKIMKFLPVFFVFISINFPAGVVLYWVASNVFRIGQQEIISRYDPRLNQMTEELREDVDEHIAEDTKAMKKGNQNARKRNGKKKGR